MKNRLVFLSVLMIQCTSFSKNLVFADLNGSQPKIEKVSVENLQEENFQKQVFTSAISRTAALLVRNKNGKVEFSIFRNNREYPISVSNTIISNEMDPSSGLNVTKKTEVQIKSVGIDKLQKVSVLFRIANGILLTVLASGGLIVGGFVLLLLLALYFAGAVGASAAAVPVTVAAVAIAAGTLVYKGAHVENFYRDYNRAVEIVTEHAAKMAHVDEAMFLCETESNLKTDRMTCAEYKKIAELALNAATHNKK